MGTGPPHVYLALLFHQITSKGVRNGQAAVLQVPTERFALAVLPTPIHEWKVSGVPEGVELYIKRDDLSGMQLSGNKVR